MLNFILGFKKINRQQHGCDIFILTKTTGGKTRISTIRKKGPTLKSEILDKIKTRLNEPIDSQIRKMTIATNDGAWKRRSATQESGSAIARNEETIMENHFILPTA